MRRPAPVGTTGLGSGLGLLPRSAVVDLVVWQARKKRIPHAPQCGGSE
jgi:hypothetical protein